MRSFVAAAAACILSVTFWAGARAQVPPPRDPVVPAGPGAIAGAVQAAAGEPLQAAAVTLRSAADSSVVTGALTDAQGRFRIAGLMPGRYLLRVSLIGYLPRSSDVIEITTAAPLSDLGIIELQPSPVALDAVEASAERQAVVIEADRTTYSVRAMPVAGSGTAADVLRAVPELEVDVNDNVRLRGNQPVALHINGRPAPLRGEQLANFLRQLPGSRMDRVEVLPNPSARHDPEGIGGIVNIVLKDDLDLGLSGSASVNASTQNRHFVQGRLNYQRGRLTVFTGAGLNRFRNTSGSSDLRRNLVTVPITSIAQENSIRNQARGWSGDWTLELRVGRQATLWSNGWMFTSRNDAAGVTGYRISDELDALREQYDRADDSRFAWTQRDFGVGFKQVFQPQKQELTVDVRVAANGNDRTTDQLKLVQVLDGAPASLSPERLFNDVDAGGGNASLQADWFRPLGPARLELGYRLSHRSQDNDNVLLTFADAGSDDADSDVRSGYEYDETVHAAHATAGRPLGPFSVQAGLRAERTSTRFESRVMDVAFDRDYTSLFPSFNVSWAPRPGRMLRLLYSRRISRPTAFHIDPFVPGTDPLNVSAGNPGLRPTYTHSFSMDASHTGRHGTLRLAPYYRYTSDVWERIRTVDGDGVATSRWENAAWSRAWGSTLTLSLSPTGRVSGSATLNAYRDERDGSNISEAYRRAAVLWSLSGNIGVKVTGSLRGQLFANHFPTQSILQGRASGYTFTTVSLRQQVRGTRGSISLHVTDPLNLMSYDSRSSDATYEQRSRSTYRARLASLGFTYNFGRPPQQQSRRSAPEDEGETIRVR